MKAFFLVEFDVLDISIACLPYIIPQNDMFGMNALNTMLWVERLIQLQWYYDNMILLCLTVVLLVLA